MLSLYSILRCARRKIKRKRTLRVWVYVLCVWRRRRRRRTFSKTYMYNKKLMNSCHEYNMFSTFHIFLGLVRHIKSCSMFACMRSCIFLAICAEKHFVSGFSFLFRIFATISLYIRVSVCVFFFPVYAYICGKAKWRVCVAGVRDKARQMRRIWAAIVFLPSYIVIYSALYCSTIGYMLHKSYSHVYVYMMGYDFFTLPLTACIMVDWLLLCKNG